MKKIKILAIIPVLSFILGLPFGISAIGLVTEPVVISHALRGGEFQETLNIVNTQKEDVVVVLSADGAIATWAKFYQPGNLKNAIGEIPIVASGKADIIVIFTVPSDTPNGTYKGLVSATQKAKALKPSEGSSVSIGQRVDREVTINVSDKEIIAVKASIIPEKYDLAKNEPLKIRVIYDNQGNISVTPQIQLKIKNSEQVVYNAIFPYPETEPAVKPAAIYEIPAIEIPTSGFSDGKYLTEIVISQGEQKLLEDSFQFSLGMFSVTNPTGAAIGLFSGKFIINWFIIGVCLIIIAAVVIVKLLKNNKKRTGKNRLKTL